MDFIIIHEMFCFYKMKIYKDWKIVKKRMYEERMKSSNDFVSSSKLISFLIVAEDHRYYHHIGFDLISIIRALLKNIYCKKREGASTIDQQLVRVLTNDYSITISRKFKEIFLAIMLDKNYDKNSIALIYLNLAYYGTDYQNLDAILRKFNLNKKQMIDDDICAEIIARLKYPEPHCYSETRHSQIENRKKYILYLHSNARRL
jgi:membrane peptidoglycan carboxypeptidase